MFKRILILILFGVSGLYAQSIKPDPETLSYIRTEFYQAVEDEDSAEKLLRFLKDDLNYNQDNYPPKILAYTGALEAVMAKHVFNPYSKFKYVIMGIKKLNKAVEDSPDILEIRFLRFAVLHNIPAVFGVGDERESDLNTVYKLLLEKDYSDVNQDLQKGVADFLLKSERLNKDQEMNLLQVFPEIKKQ